MDMIHLFATVLLLSVTLSDAPSESLTYLHIHTITIFSDGLLQAKLKFAAQELNLREHLVNRTTLYSACDVEGHRGK